ncbi:MAG: tetratricopeptide repeat protein [Bacteroidia bacterium]
MRKQQFQVLSALCIAGIGIAGCNGLSKMIKDASKISYTVNPNPLQDNGDSVAINIAVKYPAEYFNKKAVVTVTPTLKMAGGKEQALDPVTLVGEAATGTGTKINFKEGGSLNYNKKIAFTPDMKMDSLVIKATLTNNNKDFPAMKVANGTIATALLIQNDDKLVMAKDNFQKTIPEMDTTHIYYLISQSGVRPTEMSSKEMKEFKEFVEKAVMEGWKFDGINVSAYASPDGETDMNQHLADDRAKTAIAAMKSMFKEMESKKLDTKFGAEESFYKTGTTGMDWDGFRNAVQASDIKDKDLIIRVLSMYTDHDQRMKEIKNMSKTYVELADHILPRLRRAIIQLNAEKMSRTDAQISQLATSHPDSLSVEELLYAATLTTDMNQKLSIYMAAEKQYPNDWRCSNNVGYIEMMQNKLSDAAGEFQKAAGLAPNNTSVINNMGVVARWKGDRKTAMDDFKKSGTPEATYNMGLVDIQTGNYADAATNVGSNNTFNAALAKLLNNDIPNAKAALDGSNLDNAWVSYLRAVIAARAGDKNDLVNQLKAAINKDATLKTQAQSDCEFLKFVNDPDFKAAIQ